MRKSYFSIICLSASSLLLAACSEEEAAAPSRDNVTEELVSEGMNPDVATCVSGLQVNAKDTRPVEVLRESCQEAREAVTGATETELPVEELAFAEEIKKYGDSSELDALWDQCEQGNGASCDELFNSAPIGSEYEEFGLTCGNRQDVLHCTELDVEETKLVPKIAQQE